MTNLDDLKICSDTDPTDIVVINQRSYAVPPDVARVVRAYQTWPDLLTPLTAICDFIDNEGPAAKEWEAISSWCEKGRAAIAKAKGGVA